MKGDHSARFRVLGLIATYTLIATAVAEEPSSGPSTLPAPQAFRIHIETLPIAKALTELGQQTSLNIIIDSAISDGVSSSPIAGLYTADEALRRLLTPVGLKADYLDHKTVAIRLLQSESEHTRAALPVSNSTDATSDESKPTKQQKQGNGEPAPGRNSQTDQGPTKDAPTDQAPEKKGIAEILIKGARTMNVDVKRSEDDALAYTILDSEQIEKSGASNVEEFLKQQLTMSTVAATNAQLSPGVGFGGTTSSVNLRGLGTNETLILIDGRRVAAVSLSGNGGGQPDINGIPLSAIDRIEVLPSSASAIYGGAAVGGVVNIIMKKTFEGGDLSFSYDKPTSSDAHQRTLSVAFGKSLFDGMTQIMVGGQYQDASPLRLQDRQNLVGRGIGAILRNAPAYLYNPTQPFFGASTNIASADGSYNDDFTVFTPEPLSLLDGTPLNSAITAIPVGSGPGSNLSPGLLANAGRYNLNLAPGNGLYGLQSPFGSTPLTKSLFATIRQTIFQDAQLFAEVSANSNASRTINNPFAQVFTVPSAAPTNPFQQDVYVTFPSTVAAPETTDSVTHSATVGLIVPLGRGWGTELDYTWSRNAFETSIVGVDNQSFSSALSDGTINPFLDTVSNPLALSSYLDLDTWSGSSTLNDVTLRASGAIGSLPAGQPTLTIGLEHRKEGVGDGQSNLTLPLTPENSSNLEYFEQSQSTNSLYAEALAPLVSDKNALPGIRSLDLQVAGRSERYTVIDGTPYRFTKPDFLAECCNPIQGVHSTIKYTSTNPTVGLKYRPVEDFTFRASYSKAFLPPTATQLLLNPTPVCGDTPCQLITDPKNGLSYNINFTSSGNPSLRPQTSKDLDLGLIWEPHIDVLQGLRADIEYYKINQPNYITSPTPQQVIDYPTLAARVTRDPATGLITTVDASFLNATEYKTSGWDLKLDYRKPTAIGTFDLHASGTAIKYDQRQLNIGAPFFEFAGYPNDGGEGKIRAVATLTWEYRHLTAAWTTTYYSGYYQEDSVGSPSYLESGAFLPIPEAQGSNSVPSQTYHDVFASYSFSEASDGRLLNSVLSNLVVSLRIKNVFNSSPPFDAATQAYFYSPFGDPRLRDYRISIRKSF